MPASRSNRARLVGGGPPAIPYKPSAYFQENTMKHLRKLCTAVTLLFVLSLSAHAGEITIWGAAPPPPPPPPASATAAEPGEITTWGTQNPVESDTLVTEIPPAILQLLPVF